MRAAAVAVVQHQNRFAVAIGQGAVISWVAPSETGPGLQSYVVKVGGATFQTGLGQTKVTLPPQLQPGRVYSVQVWAVNANGAGPPATAQLTASNDAAPPSAGRRQIWLSPLRLEEK